MTLLPACKLQALNLSSNKLSTCRSAENIAKVLVESKTLKTLELKRLRLSPDVLKYLAKGFSHRLTSLVLDSNNLLNEGISTLKDQFRTGEGDNKASAEPLWSLKKLSLSENGFNDMC